MCHKDVTTGLPDHLGGGGMVRCTELPKLSHFWNMNHRRQAQKALDRPEYHLRDDTDWKIIKTDKQVHRSCTIISSFSQQPSPGFTLLFFSFLSYGSF